jgi:hypothetical protein
MKTDHGEMFQGKVTSLIEAVWRIRRLDDTHVLDSDPKFIIFVVSRL